MVKEAYRVNDSIEKMEKLTPIISKTLSSLSFDLIKLVKNGVA
jgi:hypothetical protein